MRSTPGRESSRAQAARPRPRDGVAVLLRGHDGTGAARRHQPPDPHAMGYSRYFSTICVTLADTGWAAGVGAKRGVDLREIGEHSDLVVIWGGNPVNTQVNVMSHAMQAQAARRDVSWWWTPTAPTTAAKADLHLAPRPGTDGALACAIMHVLFAEGMSRLGLPARLHRLPRTSGRPTWPRGRPQWAAAHHRPLGGPDRGLRPPLRADPGRASSAATTASAASRNGAVNMHAVSCLPAITGAWRQQGRRRGLRPDRDLPPRPHP